mmetsp:Transcript_43869/g.72881  ORF Transcript_43869/g.72881 Transcript_43869/m.72881 type:complete len:202 (-) Transcript_43869:1434-2039(-)
MLSDVRAAPGSSTRPSKPLDSPSSLVFALPWPLVSPLPWPLTSQTPESLPSPLPSPAALISLQSLYSPGWWLLSATTLSLSLSLRPLPATSPSSAASTGSTTSPPPPLLSLQPEPPQLPVLPGSSRGAASIVSAPRLAPPCPKKPAVAPGAAVSLAPLPPSVKKDISAAAQRAASSDGRKRHSSASILSPFGLSEVASVEA